MSCMKKPDIDTFRNLLARTGGSKSKVAASLGVDRSTVGRWESEDPMFRQAIKDERGKVVDTCLVTAQLLAAGIPDIDSDGKFCGWIERPDPNMIRYLLSTLGRREGFGDEEPEAAIPTDIKHGVKIDEWIKHRTND